MIKNDVPIEGVLKYIKRERDKYKQKCETVSAYAKQLELALKNISNERIKELESEIKSLNSKLASANNDRENLKAENKALRNDFRTSTWYANLMDSKEKKNKENLLLKRMNSALLTEIDSLKKDLEETV